VILSFLFWTSVAKAQAYDPLMTVRVSAAAMQGLLAAPPLPNLTEKGLSSVSAQVGYLVGDVDGSFAPGMGYSGKFTGGNVGVAYAGHIRHKFGVFAMLAANTLSGSIDGEVNSNSTEINIRDATTQGQLASGGISGRFFGDDRSLVALGGFIGPAAFRFNTKFKTVSNTTTADYSASPIFYGTFAGLETEVRLGAFTITPYLLFFLDLSPECKAYETGPQTVTGPLYCGTQNELPLSGTFGAYGVFFGYEALRINAYTNIESSMNNIVVHNYQVSYSINF
jgi:hypothetical protein